MSASDSTTSSQTGAASALATAVTLNFALPIKTEPLNLNMLFVNLHKHHDTSSDSEALPHERQLSEISLLHANL